MKNYKEVIENLKSDVVFQNHNTQFFTTKDGQMMMCEFTKDCKYTSFSTIEKFAKRILRFTKTGC